ncbi:MAG: DUF2059 domain-containing protein [Flavisolibacter sp.]
MINKSYLLAVMLLTAIFSNAQSDSSSKNKAMSSLAKIIMEVKEFKPDTSNVPEDKITRKIRELRNIKGGFNINSVMDFKLEEDASKNEIPKATLALLKEQFTNGNGKRWLENATIWIYRKEFTYKELKQLTRFYKTDAGKKLSEQFPAIVLKSIMSAEVIRNGIIEKAKKGG